MGKGNRTMLTSDEVYSQLKELMAKIMKITPEEIEKIVRMNSNLRDDIGIDSVESLDFIYTLEDRYSIDISDEEAIGLNAVSDVVNLVLKKGK